MFNTHVEWMSHTCPYFPATLHQITKTDGDNREVWMNNYVKVEQPAVNSLKSKALHAA